MKRLTLLLSFVALLGLAAGCNTSQDKFLEKDGVTATFNIALPGEQMPTKAISDGTGATELLFKVYDAKGNNLTDLDQTVTVSDKKATITVNLVRGVAYSFVFWAQKPGQYTIEDGKITISEETLPSMMNNDAYDAFYALEKVAAQEDDFTVDVTLYRPFAQINVGASADDISNALANRLEVGRKLKTSFSLKGVNNVLDLLTGEVSGNVDVDYTSAPATSDDITTTDGATYRRIAMVYVLAGTQSSTLPVSFSVSTKQSSTIDVEFTREVPNTPVRRNHRTNIIGEIFSLQGTFNVLVDADFAEPDNDIQVDVPTPTPVRYEVTFDQNIEHGWIAQAVTTNYFAEGVNVKLVAQPEENYELTYLAYTPAEGGEAVEIDINTMTFVMPAFDVFVTGRFSYVNPGPGPGGEEGSGTADDPYTIAGVRAFIDGLNGNVSEEAVYVKGVVSRVVGTPSTTYTNASFFMTDPDGTDEFEAFRINFFNDAPWTVDDPLPVKGDKVVVYGKVVLFTPSSGDPIYETNQVANGDHGYLISWNGMDNVMFAPTITAKDASGATTTVIPAGDNEYLTVNIFAAKSATIYYTTDGSEPTDASTKFTQDFNVTSACTIKAIAYGEGSIPSKVSSLAITKASSGGGSDTVIDIDFTAQIEALPQLSANGQQDGTYTLGGYQFVLHAADKFYQAVSNNSYYLLIGKANSYIELPVISGKALAEVEFLTGAGASESVIVDVAKTDGTRLNVNTAALLKGHTYTWTVNGEVGVAYRLLVTNKYNAQFQTLKLTYR